MNLFFIDQWLEKSANSLCDAHVVKMILETAQVLYACWYCRAELPKSSLVPYKLTHKNHPIALWVREREANYLYACMYGILLCAEYTQRYGKYHKTEAHLRQLYSWGFPRRTHEDPPVKKAKAIDFAYHNVPYGIEKIPLCMDSEHYVQDENGNLLGVESYRNYYRWKKDNIKKKMAWKQNKPHWFEGV